MIDLVNVELAHELLTKIPDNKWYIRHYVTEVFTHDGGCTANSTSFMLLHPDEYDEEFKCIDDLIAKLKELAQIKPKYEVGQEVFALKRRGIIGLMSGHIKEYDVNDNDYYVVFVGYGGYWLDEKKIYPSRESLIQAQIDYWQSLKVECISNSKICPKCGMQRVSDGLCWAIGCDYRCDEKSKESGKVCEHESNGKMYGAMEWGASGQLKCKKCGEFY